MPGLGATWGRDLGKPVVAMDSPSGRKPGNCVHIGAAEAPACGTGKLATYIRAFTEPKAFSQRRAWVFTEGVSRSQEDSPTSPRLGRFAWIRTFMAAIPDKKAFPECPSFVRGFIRPEYPQNRLLVFLFQAGPHFAIHHRGAMGGCFLG